MAERKVEIRVSVDDKDAGVRLDALRAKLDALTKRIFTIRVRLDDGGASLALDKLIAKLEKITKKDYSPKIKADGIKRVDTALDKLRLNLDRVARTRTITIKVDTKGVSSAAVGKTLAAAGVPGAGGAAAGGGASAGAGIGAVLGGTGIGVLITFLAATAAALIPAIVGLGVGGLGTMIAHSLDPKAFTGVLNQGKRSVLNAVGNSQTGIFGGQPALLPGVGEQGIGRQQGSFLGNILAILSQIDKFIKSISPELRGMFMASLPFVRSFISVFEAFAKATLPALTQMMQQFKSSGALKIFTQGLMALTPILASFLKGLGPGMKDAAIVFKTAMIVVAAAAKGLGYVISGLAILFVDTAEGAKIFASKVRLNWDQLRHATADAFDRIRHGVSDAFAWISAHFDQWRHGWANIWDYTWQSTVGTLIRFNDRASQIINTFLGNIVHWISKLPGELESIGKTAINSFLSGMKSIGSSVWSWIKSFFGGIPHWVMSVLHMSPPHPGSAFYDLGANFMHHLEAGMKARAGSLKAASGNLGGSVNSWIMAALKLTHSPMSWLPAIQRLVSLESGGNPRAVNPISVLGQHASGLYQMLPSTFANWSLGGSIWNPIAEGVAALRYIRNLYSTPFNIPGLFGGGYRGYAAGGMITEPILGMGLHTGMTYGFGENAPGRPEYVSPAGAGGITNIHITVQGDTDPDAAARRIHQMLRKYKTHKGNKPLGLG